MTEDQDAMLRELHESLAWMRRTVPGSGEKGKPDTDRTVGDLLPEFLAYFYQSPTRRGKSRLDSMDDLLTASRVTFTASWWTIRGLAVVAAVLGSIAAIRAGLSGGEQ